MNQNAHLTERPVRPAPAEITVGLERKWFEFDRSSVLHQIDLVHCTIDANAHDLAMVAVEGVFDKPLSEELSRASRSLHQTAQGLTALRSKIARASGYPKAEKKRA